MITTEQQDAISLGEKAITQEEKDFALAAFKAAFPGQESYLTMWSDGTTSE
jgi:hypothetical protein